MNVPSWLSWLIQSPPADFEPMDPERILDWNVRNAFGGVVRMFPVSKVSGVPTLPDHGFEYLTFMGWIPRYIAYRGTPETTGEKDDNLDEIIEQTEFYFGFRPSGLFGIGLRHRHSKNYTQTPQK